MTERRHDSTGAQLVRYDAAQLRVQPEMTPEGFLIVEITFARCGVYEYEQPDGSVRLELVLDDELHDPASLETMRYKCVTSEHPEDDVTSANVRELSVGDVPETPRVIEGGLVSVKAVVKDARAVAEIRSGERDKASPGYTLRALDETPGTHPIYGRYDAIQRGRVYNHLALTEAPRGGDGMRVRLDSATQRRTDSMFTPAPTAPTPTPDEDTMDPEELKKILAALLTASLQPITERLSALEARISKTDNDDPEQPTVKTDNDDPEQPTPTPKTDNDDPEQPVAMNHDSRVKWFAERQRLTRAAEVVGLDGEMDRLTNGQLKKKIVLHARKDAKRNEGAAYYNAAFDMLDLEGQPEGRHVDPWGNLGGGAGGHREDSRQQRPEEFAEDAFMKTLRGASTTSR